MSRTNSVALPPLHEFCHTPPLTSVHFLEVIVIVPTQVNKSSSQLSSNSSLSPWPLHIAGWLCHCRILRHRLHLSHFKGK